jgi:uncharacterized membrane protein YbhN (UPF0104 family)
VLILAAGVVAAVVGLYVLMPRVAGLDETRGRIRDGDQRWIVLAALFELGSYAGYVLLLLGVVGRVAGAGRDRCGGRGETVGALVAFGEPAGLALAAVLTYRALGFWLPTVPGATAYVPLTRGLGHPRGEALSQGPPRPAGRR